MPGLGADMKEKTYNDYTLDEKLIYAKGWNAAVKASAKIVETKFNNHGWNYHLPSVGREMAHDILKLDKSIQACDD
jgi:hypothetical protein